MIKNRRLNSKKVYKVHLLWKFLRKFHCLFKNTIIMKFKTATINQGVSTKTMQCNQNSYCKAVSDFPKLDLCTTTPIVVPLFSSWFASKTKNSGMETTTEKMEIPRTAIYERATVNRDAALIGKATRQKRLTVTAVIVQMVDTIVI